MVQQKSPLDWRVYAFLSSLLLGLFSFEGGLLVLAAIGEMDTAVTIGDFLGFLVGPRAFIAELICGSLLLRYSLKAERAEELRQWQHALDNTSRIIIPFSPRDQQEIRTPAQPKPRRLALKLAVGMMALAALVVVSFGAYSWTNPKLEFHPRVASYPPAPSVPPSSQEKQPTTDSVATVAEPAKSQPGKQTQPPATPVKLNVPATQDAQTGDGELVAQINGTRVRAKDKPPGATCVAVRLSDVTRYRGGVTQQQADAAIEAMKKLEGVRVFSVDLGSYTVQSPLGAMYSFNIVSDAQKFVYYFNMKSEPMAKLIQEALTKILGGPVGISYFQINRQKTGIDETSDFMDIAGLDIEVKL